jgi:hypothetical protein
MPRGNDVKAEEKAQLCALFFELSVLNKDLSKTQVINLVSKKSGRATRTIWRILAQHELLRTQSSTEMVDFGPTCTKRKGPPNKLTGRLKKKIRHENSQANFSLPIRTLALRLKMKKSTLHRYTKLMGAKTMISYAKPTLSKDQKLKRLQFVLNLRAGSSTKFVDQFNVIHVDESWFYMHQEKKKVRVFPGDKTPEPTRVRHKSHIEKMMFLTAVARPQPKHNFSGKVAIQRVCTFKRALKTSKNHQRGEKYKADCNMDAVLFKVHMRKVMIEVRKKMPWLKGKPVVIQFDGAAPHTGKDNLEVLNIEGQRYG